MEDANEATAGDAAPLLETATFAVLFGPDGAVRLDLTAEGRTFARLTLDATTADDLARALEYRRATYAREQGQGGRAKGAEGEGAEGECAEGEGTP